MTNATSSNAFSRRSFLRTGAVAGGAAAATGLAAPAVLAQSPVTVKMQTSWPASDIWMDMARQYTAHGRGDVRGPDQVRPDAGRRGGRRLPGDGRRQRRRHRRGPHRRLPTGTASTRRRPSSAPARCSAARRRRCSAGSTRAAAQELYRELTQDIMGLNVYGFFGFPMPAQPFGWFKNPIAGKDDIQGFKYRTVGLAADLMQQMGMSVSQLPGGEIVPAMERGVIDAYEFNNPSSDLRFGSADVAKNYYLGSYHQASESLRVPVQPRLLRRPRARPPGDPEARGLGGVERQHLLRAEELLRRPAEAPERARRQHPQDPEGHPGGASSSPGTC